jgi:hypothetical protein
MYTFSGCGLTSGYTSGEEAMLYRRDFKSAPRVLICSHCRKIIRAGDPFVMLVRYRLEPQAKSQAFDSNRGQGRSTKFESRNDGIPYEFRAGPFESASGLEAPTDPVYSRLLECPPAKVNVDWQKLGVRVLPPKGFQLHGLAVVAYYHCTGCGISNGSRWALPGDCGRGKHP